MANVIQPQIEKINVNFDENDIFNALQSAQVVNRIQPQMIDYFTQQTEVVTRTNDQFLNLKNRINNCIQAIDGSKSVRKYFDGYQAILEARTFFLGKLGEITYTFVVAIEGRVLEINIDTKTLIDLIFKNKKMGLTGRGNTLRFNTEFKHNLQNYLFDILVTQSGFELIVNNQKINLKFQSPSWMKAELDRIRSMKERNYTFYLNLEITGKNQNGEPTIKWVYANPTSGFRHTSSVFSAVGHYAIDEENAKKQALATNEISTNRRVSTNIGNLTEIYIKAKEALNQGRNDFRPKKHIYGENLFNIFQQVRSNTDPFYAGGDDLERQIKSLLGSMPSLTSFKAIRNELKDLQNALNQGSLTEIKAEIERMFIKNITKINNGVDKQQRQLAKLLKITLNQMSISG